MKVIGAGLPRTATLTQKVALEMLGFAPCYHMVNVLGNLDNAPRWQEALEGRNEWDDIFGDFQATVDWPGAYFYRDLMEAYPDAKVLLSVRDGEAWERSMGETIWGIFYGDMLIHDLSSAWSRVDPKWAGYISLMKTMWEKSGLLGSENEGPGGGAMARAMEAVQPRSHKYSAGRPPPGMVPRRRLGASLRVPRRCRPGRSGPPHQRRQAVQRQDR